MLYPENTAAIAKIKTWINASIARAVTQQQNASISIQEINNPFRKDPWELAAMNKAIILHDGYIMPKFPVAGTYEPILDRYPMAVEATKELVNWLSTLSVDFNQDAALLNSEALLFFQWLYTWNVELVWVDKVHPEDWVANVLFGTTAPTYLNRSIAAGGLNPDIFLRGSTYYETDTWLGKLTQYGTLDSTEFAWGTKTFSLYYPGAGYAYGKVKEAFEKQSTARGISQSILGVMIAALPTTDKGKLTSQYWAHRMAILTDAAVYSNGYVSYLTRFGS